MSKRPARRSLAAAGNLSGDVSRTDRIAAYAAVPVLWLALAGPLFSLPVFKRGLWELAEPIVIALFAAAGLAALLLAAWLAAGGRPSRPARLLALPAFLLAVWLLVSGPGGFSGVEWRLRLLGVPQSGFGPLWYAGLGLWILLGDLVLRQPRAWRLVLWGGFAASAATLVVLGLDRIGGTSTVFQVLAYYAWLGLALPAMAWALPMQGRLDIAERILAGLLAFGLLVLSEAMTMMGAAVIGLALALLWWRLPQGGLFGLARRPAMLALILAGAALLPLLLVSIPSLVGDVASLESRRMVWLMMWAVPEYQPLAWLVGNGAGTISNTMMSHVIFSGHPLWRVDEWDMLTSNYLHAHNWLLQALHDGGLPAVLLTAWLMLQLVWLAAPMRRGMALGLMVAYLLSLGLWFELIFAVPYMALAWIAVLGRQAQPAAQMQGVRNATWARASAAGGLILLAAAYFWGAVVQERFARQIDLQLAWFSDRDEAQRPPLVPPPPLPEDPRRADMQFADLINFQLRSLVYRHEPGQPPPYAEREAARITWLLQIIQQRLADTLSPLLPLHGEKLFSEIMLRPGMAAYQPLLLPHIGLWRQIVERGVELAPWRSDMALGYLNWTLQNGRQDLTRELAQRLRRARPEDPIGLFYESALLILQPDLEAKRRGAELARRAMAAGVEQFFELNDTYKAAIAAIK
ncbi:hypothetical protein [Ferrovibrio sp.]|uniref:hypothetical protein n=1 Tax=Ferrovibrio sp. TaxID=1917215 RepID=UPI003D151BA6